jgi:hypothetical protein
MLIDTSILETILRFYFHTLSIRRI